MANLTCAPDTRSVESILSPSIQWVYTHGHDVKDPAMTYCCAPNPVNLLNGCIEWCELPRQYTNTSDARKSALSDFSHCLRLQGSTTPGGVGSNVSSAAAVGYSLKTIGVLFLIASCALL